NIMTRPAPIAPEAEASIEAGSFGWKRLLLTGGNTWGDDGLRADLNLTRTDGWRDATDYRRNGSTLRWDRMLGDAAHLKTVLTYSDIDQHTAGSSAITLDDYLNNPTVNYTPISFRKVKAARLSAAYEKETGNSLLSITPYVRDDSMDLLANWSLGYDPTVYNTSNQSFGVQAKYRTDFEPYRARLIVGVDIDRSPGSRDERSVTTTKVGSIYTSYTQGVQVYDYKVTYQGVSPYVHGELSPSDALRVTAGLRYDAMGYDFRNNLPATAVTAVTSVGTKYYGQDADTQLNYTHFSPKLGATYAFSESFNGFVSYNHAFRAPSEGQLFRPAPSSSSTSQAQQIAAGNLALQPVKVDSYETGVRGKAGASVSYEVSLYYMTKRDDILTQKDPVTAAPIQTNGGTTLHRGVEIGGSAALAPALKLDVSLSYARHSYDSWITSTVDYSGNEMSLAPRLIADTRLTYSPAELNGGDVGIELVTLGKYWMDDANTTEYDGHNLWNLSGSYYFSKDVSLFAKLRNLTDRRFAESTSGISSYAPGMPRTLYVGVQSTWK
ncbi:MAG TPA: TonB-dependent receptor, partial [Gallionellaceae bacterium]|nr:TonB-dependent receptor [Gallionellaceae bacterium]